MVDSKTSDVKKIVARALHRLTFRNPDCCQLHVGNFIAIAYLFNENIPEDIAATHSRF